MATRATAAADNDRNLPKITNNFYPEEAKIGELNPSEKVTAIISTTDLLAGKCLVGNLHPTRKLSRKSTTDE